MFKQTKFVKRSSIYLQVITSQKIVNYFKKKQKNPEKNEKQQHYVQLLHQNYLN